MKFFFIGLLMLGLIRSCYHRTGQGVSDAVTLPTNAPSRVDSLHTLSFESDIMPIFKAKCSPCHFPGGKMYQKMPFDKPQTFKDNRNGILNRMKSNPEVDKIRAFIESLP